MVRVGIEAKAECQRAPFLSVPIYTLTETLDNPLQEWSWNAQQNPAQCESQQLASAGLICLHGLLTV